jgi:DUF4097 and DUF4098 domain-containing protein YvlB
MSGHTLRRPLILTILVALAFTTTAIADFRLERELALAPGGTFLLDSDTGSIEIRGVDRSGARILITSKRDDVEERFSFSFEERGDDAVVRVEKRGSWLSGIFSGHNDRVHFEIQVPRGAEVDLSTAGGAIDAESIRGRLDLHSSGGSIGVTDIEGDVAARTSGGDVSADNVRGDVHLSTSGGAIQAQGIDGDLVAKTSGGSIELQEAGGAVEAHTSGGPVRASFAAGNASGGSLSSSGGGITAIVDPAVALNVDAHTSGGRVSVDLPIAARVSSSRNTLRGELNGGGNLLKLRSSGGSIKVRGD